MQPIYRLLFFLTSFPCTIIAQNNFKPGFVITTKGDTLRGAIDLTRGNNFKEISFRSLPADKIQKFNPANINYYSVINVASYLSYDGKVSTDHTDISKISNMRDTSTIQVNVFIKVEQQGDRVYLYSYTDNIKTRYFIKETNSNQPVELSYRVYYINAGQAKDEEFYKVQLSNLAAKYNVKDEKLISLIRQINYSLYDLQTVCKSINKSSAIVNNVDLNYFRFFAGVALNSTKTDPKNYSLPFYNASAGTFIFPKIIIGVDFYPNPIVQKFIVRAELSATKNKYNSSVDSYTDSRPLSKTTYGFDQFNLAFTTQFLYDFYYTYNLKIYGGTGVSANFSSYSGNLYRNLYTNQTTVLNLPKVWASVPIRIGAIIKNKIDVSAGYTLPVNMSFSQSSMQVGVGYYLSK
jgi:hypothetical protein